MTSTHSSADEARIEENVATFFGAYCRAFEARDVEALARFFSYPILLTNAEAQQRVLGSPGDYVATIEPLVALYRELGAERAKVLHLEIVPLAPTLAVAIVDWEVAAGDERPLYTHRASYTLVRTDEWLIAAIAVNELPKLREALWIQRDALGRS